MKTSLTSKIRDFCTHTHTHLISEKQNNEYGRSMVEMLAVLAVIGVLSVAGIAGFSRAMDKNRTNTIVHEAQKRATSIVAQIQMLGSANPSIADYTNNDLGYAEFDTTVYTNSNLATMPKGQFGIKVSDVSKAICQDILNTIGDNTVIRRLSTESAPRTALTTCGETNTFLMVYNNDMSGQPIASDYTYDNCPENFHQCDTTNSCVATENDCPNICELDEDLSTGCVCPEHRDRTDNKCGNCVDVEMYDTWDQPKLTSTTANGTMGSGDFAVQASSENDGTRKAWRAFDGYNNNPETNCWHSRSSTNRWLSWYTKNPTKVKSITIHNRGDGGAVGVLAVADFEIQYSDNNSTWTTVISGTNPSNVAYDFYPQAVNATSAHSYWRINILTSYNSGGSKDDNSHVTIGELIVNADELVSVTNYELNASGYCAAVE